MPLHVCPDFPEELSKLSLTEQPSPLYCERKSDLWQHINGTDLEEADSDSNFCPYHNHLNLLPAANPGYFALINGMHAAPLMTVPPYGCSQDEVACCTLQHHNKHDGTGGRCSWYCRRHGALNAAGDGVTGTVVSRRASASVSCRRPSTAAVTDNKPQTVSRLTSDSHCSCIIH